MCIDVCIDVCIGVCTDICMNVCVGICLASVHIPCIALYKHIHCQSMGAGLYEAMRIKMCTDICMDIYLDKRIGTFADVCMHLHVEMCNDVCIDMSISAFVCTDVCTWPVCV